jgi:hypothetical protein
MLETWASLSFRNFVELIGYPSHSWMLRFRIAQQIGTEIIYNGGGLKLKVMLINISLCSLQYPTISMSNSNYFIYAA